MFGILGSQSSHIPYMVMNDIKIFRVEVTYSTQQSLYRRHICMINIIDHCVGQIICQWSLQLPSPTFLIAMRHNSACDFGYQALLLFSVQDWKAGNGLGMRLQLNLCLNYSCEVLLHVSMRSVLTKFSLTSLTARGVGMQDLSKVVVKKIHAR